MPDAMRKRLKVTRAIREAIDTWPDGICFALVDGRPILANKTINDLCSRLTGHTITNAERTWTDLKALEHAFLPDESRTDASLINPVNPDPEPERFLCRLDDGTVWQFQRQDLDIRTVPVVQYEAADITELYHYRNRLRENIAQAEKLQERQRDLLRNIVQNNLDKEMLEAKIRIHDNFGRVLLMSRSVLREETVSPKADDLFAAWAGVISDMENASSRRTSSLNTPEKELIQVAEMIGCRVRFHGRQPSERKPLLLLYAAVREALTNAVRHAGADCLTIDIRDNGDSYHAEIRSNGRKTSTPIREGGGLGNLRRRLEQEGARLQIDSHDGVVLILTLPKE